MRNSEQLVISPVTHKNGRTQRVISIAICISMLISIAGCAINAKTDKDAPANTNSITDTAAVTVVSGETVAADAPYYSLNEIMLYTPANAGDYVNVRSVIPCKDQAAVLLEAGISDESSGEFTAKSMILLIDKTGRKTAEIDVNKEIGPSGNVIYMAADADGNLTAFVEDNSLETRKYLMYKFSSAGTQIGAPADLQTGKDLVISSAAIDKAGDIYLVSFGQISVLDSSGQEKYIISDDKIESYIYLIGDKLYAESSKGTKLETDGKPNLYYPVDTEARKLGEAIDISQYRSKGIIIAGTAGFFVNSAAGVYAVDLESKEQKEFLQWKNTDADMSLYGGGQTAVLSYDVIVCTGQNQSVSGTPCYLGIFTRQQNNPNAGKKVIVLGGVDISGGTSLNAAIYTFNKESKEYRIEVKDYAAEFNETRYEFTYDEILNELQRLGTVMQQDVESGKGPDIIIDNGSMSFNLLESKGLLADLYPLMEKDSDFKKDDYLPSIFTLCEKDGKLSKMIVNFDMSVLAGARTVVGDRSGWTVDSFNEMADSLPDGVAPLAGMSQSQLLSASLSGSLQSFADVSSGKADFNSASFLSMLAFAKTYGIKDTPDNNNNVAIVDDLDLARNHALALAHCYIHSAYDYERIEAAFGEPVSIVGYPSPDLAGALCVPGGIFAVAASSKYPDAAWDFAKILLSESIQENVMGIPVLKSAFEKQIDNAIDPPEDIIKYGIASGPMSETQVKSYRDLVYSLNTLASADREILGIIMEEAPSYFFDQKSAEDVAALIQNRVQTLVEERQ